MRADECSMIRMHMNQLTFYILTLKMNVDSVEDDELKKEINGRIKYFQETYNGLRSMLNMAIKDDK